MDVNDELWKCYQVQISIIYSVYEMFKVLVDEEFIYINISKWLLEILD